MKTPKLPVGLGSAASPVSASSGSDEKENIVTEERTTADVNNAVDAAPRAWNKSSSTSKRKSVKRKSIKLNKDGGLLGATNENELPTVEVSQSQIARSSAANKSADMESVLENYSYLLIAL